MSNVVEKGEEIRDAVLAHYLETGKAATVKEIAGRVSFSESTVRKVMTSKPHYGVVAGTDITSKEIECYSRDYPGMISGYRNVDAFVPSRSYMAEVIKAAREVAA